MKYPKVPAMLLCTISGILLGLAIGKSIFATENHNHDEPKWDYMIDLHQDNMTVYTDHGDTLIINHGELEEFFLNDNL